MVIKYFLGASILLNIYAILSLLNFSSEQISAEASVEDFAQISVPLNVSSDVVPPVSDYLFERSIGYAGSGNRIRDQSIQWRKYQNRCFRRFDFNWPHTGK